jgi:hypothetical protein
VLRKAAGSVSELMLSIRYTSSPCCVHRPFCSMDSSGKPMQDVYSDRHCLKRGCTGVSCRQPLCSA